MYCNKPKEYIKYFSCYNCNCLGFFQETRGLLSVLGWKLSNVIGLFAEGEYNKMWDREFFTSKIGINITFK